MKQIQPVSIWYNGQLLQANYFNLTSISDNLSTSATFYYQLLISNTDILNQNNIIAQGNLIMTGTDYQTYSSSSTSNDFAYQWGANQLKLTLI
jgi:hypothetical protein